ncbi:MAG: hypothetical protein GY805_09425 [Chloroflexi bacterium]|nr:hypothetical protein [Chloroflexota bacterium]
MKGETAVSHQLKLSCGVWRKRPLPINLIQNCQPISRLALSLTAVTHQLKLSCGGNGRFQYRFAKAGRDGDKGEFAALL